MKHYSIILVLAFLLLAFPISFKSQTHKSSAKTQKVKQNSDEVQAKEVVKQLIDGFFIKRKFLPVFQNLFSFAPCDKIDKEVLLDQNCMYGIFYPNELKEIKTDRKTLLRITTTEFRKKFLEFCYVLGTVPIDKKSPYAYPYSSSDYEILESEVLKKNSSLVSNDNFTKLNKKKIEEMLAQMNKNLDEIEHLVFERIDKELYKRNIQIMKETIDVRTVIKKGRKYFSVEVKGLIFSFILTKRNGQLKIVGMEDDI